MKTIVWSKENCPHCLQAMSLLDSHNIEYEVRKIDGVTWTREQLLEEVPTARSVPQIFMYGKLVGGYPELQTYFENTNSGSTEGKL